MVTAITTGYSIAFAILLITYLRHRREYSSSGHLTLAAGMVAIACGAILLAIFTGALFSAALASFPSRWVASSPSAR